MSRRPSPVPAGPITATPTDLPEADASVYRAIIEAVTDGVLVQDHTGVIVAWNSSAERILQTEGRLLRARSLRDARFPAIRQDGTPFSPGESPLAKTLVTGEPQSDVIMGIELASGHRAWIQTNTRPVFHHGESLPYAVIATFTDASGHPHTTPATARNTTNGTMPDASASTPASASASTSISASISSSDTPASRTRANDPTPSTGPDETGDPLKSIFLARVSHELRTPLNSMLGFTNVLLKNHEGRLQETDLLYLDRIRANGAHLLNLIGDILDLSKIESGRMQLDVGQVDIAMLAREAVSQFEAYVRPRDVELRLNTPRDPVILLTDSGKLLQILLNLISNALKFTEEGSVSVTVRHAPGSSRPVEVEVSDTGIGIPPDRHTAIFQPFEQGDLATHRRFGGTGLGLPISKSLCELMGAMLTMESTPGAGSTFRVTFFG